MSSYGKNCRDPNEKKVLKQEICIALWENIYFGYFGIEQNAKQGFSRKFLLLVKYINNSYSAIVLLGWLLYSSILGQWLLLCNVANVHRLKCDRCFTCKSWPLELRVKNCKLNCCHAFSETSNCCVQNALEVPYLSIPVQYIYSSSGALNNIVVFKYGTQEKCWYRKLIPWYGFAAWRTA